MDVFRYLFLFCLLFLVQPVVGVAELTIREPVWAGQFYPADPERLKSVLGQLCAIDSESAADYSKNGPLRALVLPHAGYSYSGPVAGYASLVLEHGRYDRVILIGPDHNIGFQGGVISDVQSYQTPLGQILLDPAAARLRQQYDFFSANSDSDAREHSLEVILPFLQILLGDFRLIPIVLGPVDVSKVASAIDPLLDARTLLVISSDLSHYLPESQAQEHDEQTIKGLLALDSGPLRLANSACGRYGLEVMLSLGRRHQWQPRLLHYGTSADGGGDRRRVVGYAAVAFFDKEKNMSEEGMLTPEEGETLVLLARRTIAESLGHRVDELPEAVRQQLGDPALQEQGAAFVTLTKKGALRGCIGSITAHRSLLNDVKANARNAAFHDPRFQPLGEKEYAELDIEVSVLTPPRKLEYHDAEDLIRKLRPKVDGVILGDGSHTATFLPQVWEQLPDPEQFLTRLCLKGGLAGDAWRRNKLEVQIYQVQHFSDQEEQD